MKKYLGAAVFVSLLAVFGCGGGAGSAATGSTSTGTGTATGTSVLATNCVATGSIPPSQGISYTYNFTNPVVKFDWSFSGAKAWRIRVSDLTYTNYLWDIACGTTADCIAAPITFGTVPAGTSSMVTPTPLASMTSYTVTIDTVSNGGGTLQCYFTAPLK